MSAAATLYDQVGGFDKILALCQRWHELCLAHPVAAHPFEHGTHPQHDVRLAAYLSEVFGGPKLYSAGYGDESFVQRTHAGHGDHPELDEICIQLFEQALMDVGVAGESAARVAAYFRRATEDQRAYLSRDAVVPERLPMNLA